MEDWAEIRRLHRAEGMPIKVIARTLGIAREHGACGAGGGRAAEVCADAGGVGGRCVRAADPGAAAGGADDAGHGDRRAGRVGHRGMTVFKDRVRELRPVYLPPDPASRTTYEAGRAGAVRLLVPAIELPVGYGQSRTAKRLPVMTTVSGYSRWAGGMLIPSRERRGPVRGLVAAAVRAAAAGCRRRWCGTARARSAGGGPDDRS